MPPKRRSKEITAAASPAANEQPTAKRLRFDDRETIVNRIQAGDLPYFTTLLQNNPNFTDNEGHNLWHLVAVHGQIPFLDLLNTERNHRNPNIPNPDALTANAANIWQLAAIHGQVPVLQWLNAKNPHRTTFWNTFYPGNRIFNISDPSALLNGANLWHLAVMHGQTAVLEWLDTERRNSNPNIPQPRTWLNGFNLWHLAVIHGQLNSLRWLDAERKKGNSNIPDPHAATNDCNLWHLAAIYGQPDSLKWLDAEHKKQNRNIPDPQALSNSNNMWHLAIGNGRPEVLDWLNTERNNNNPNIPDPQALLNGCNLWHLAVASPVKSLSWLVDYNFPGYDAILNGQSVLEKLLAALIIPNQQPLSAEESTLLPKAIAFLVSKGVRRNFTETDLQRLPAGLDSRIFLTPLEKELLPLFDEKILSVLEKALQLNIYVNIQYPNFTKTAARLFQQGYPKFNDSLINLMKMCVDHFPPSSNCKINQHYRNFCARIDYYYQQTQQQPDLQIKKQKYQQSATFSVEDVKILQTFCEKMYFIYLKQLQNELGTENYSKMLSWQMQHQQVTLMIEDPLQKTCFGQPAFQELPIRQGLYFVT